jgi:hypothetical protein
MFVHTYASIDSLLPEREHAIHICTERDRERKEISSLSLCSTLIANEHISVREEKSQEGIRERENSSLVETYIQKERERE